jgi:FkbM family methyltransferase
MIDPVRLPLTVKAATFIAHIASGVANRLQAKLLPYFQKRSMQDFELCLAALGPDDVCIDFGANMGVFTQKLAATGAQVHAYEPDPYCFAALQKRFAGISNVHLHNQAVSRTAGNLLLRRTKEFEKDPEMQSQASSIALSNDAFDLSNPIRVEVVAFHDVVKNLGQPVALIKMDIEGSEFDILDEILADYSKRQALPIGAMFIETHERYLPHRTALVKILRKANLQGRVPFRIDTYWP